MQTLTHWQFKQRSQIYGPDTQIDAILPLVMLGISILGRVVAKPALFKLQTNAAKLAVTYFRAMYLQCFVHIANDS